MPSNHSGTSLALPRSVLGKTKPWFLLPGAENRQIFLIKKKKKKKKKVSDALILLGQGPHGMERGGAETQGRC